MNHYQHQNPLGGSHQDHMMHHDHHSSSSSGSCHGSPASAAHAHDHHAHHHGHGGGGKGDMCSMNMLLNWSTTDLCIFSHHFRIPADSWLLWAAGLGFVFLFCAGYEGVKSRVREYDQWVGREAELITAKKDLDVINARDGKTDASASCSKSSSTAGEKKAPREFARSKKLTRGVLYALQYFYGMMAMLLFMTYNVQVMAACTLGALVGFLRFADDVPGAAGGEESKGACH